MVILEQGAPKMIKSRIQHIGKFQTGARSKEKILEQEEKLKRSRKHRKVKNEQEKK